MSAKWRRSRAWEREAFPRWAAPVRWVLHAFSTIWLAVILLSLVSLFAVLASVPVGLLALVPTYVIYGVTLVGVVGIVEVVGLGLLRGVTRRLGRVWRVAGFIVGGAVLMAAGAVLWHQAVWPALRYEPATGEGVRLFASFVEEYKATTIRRLPAFEMTELEFYSWWPMKLLLIAFVINMTTATIRRIEFRFVNLGVLTVHSGIIIIALGSVYYSSVKTEGDTLLAAGPPDEFGRITPGPAQRIYFDSTEVALHVRTETGRWLQLPIRGVPRYNDYGLGLTAGPTAWTEIGAPVERAEHADRELSIVAPPIPGDSFLSDVNLRVVGYAQYARPNLLSDWLIVDPRELAIRPGASLNPMHEVILRGSGAELPFFMLPRTPAARFIEGEDFDIELLDESESERLGALRETLPPGTYGALVAEVPGSGFREVLPIMRASGLREGKIELGETGYTLEVEGFQATPQLPIVTKGYEGQESSLVTIKVETPTGDRYTRWVYARFPAIAQEFVEPDPESAALGMMPARRDPEPGLKLSFIDATRAHLVLAHRLDDSYDAWLRLPGGSIEALPSAGPGEDLEVVPGELAIAFGRSWAHAERYRRPVPEPEINREKDQIGTHRFARLAVEVTSSKPGLEGWKRIVWVPFIEYVGQTSDDRDSAGAVTLPDGRQLTVAFGRMWRRLPGFTVQLVDFDMIEYEHRGAPRDYQSTVRVEPSGAPVEAWSFLPEAIRRRLPDSLRTREVRFEAFTHVAKLNAPLRAPFNIYDEGMNPVGRFFGRLVSGLNPHQYKFAQAGWDRQSWESSRQVADEKNAGLRARGLEPRHEPFARFTILHVGNNAGIHIIALGGILMALGIPWAFYVKPWLLRRKKKAIQRQLAASKAAA